MHQPGKHFNKHGRGMGYGSKAEYQKAAVDFAKSNRANPQAKIFEGTWRTRGDVTKDVQQIIINTDNKTVIIDEYQIKELTTENKIFYENFRFWVNKQSQKVDQISVVGDFEGKFLEKIGIGSTLNDVENQIGKWEEDLDVYILPNYKGICFELKDVENYDEEWIEDQMPIEIISVYEPKDCYARDIVYTIE